jgi:hypothetical protein
MRNRSIFVVTAMIMSAMVVPDPSRAANIVIPPLSNFELVGSTLKFDALVNDCIQSQPTSSFFGSSISPSSAKSELEVPAFMETGSGTTKMTTTLVTNIAFLFDNKCVSTKAFSKNYSLALPEGLTFKYIYEQYTQSFIFSTSGELPQPLPETLSPSESPVLSGPTSEMPLEIANAKLSGDFLTFEADLPECAINKPATRYFSSLISPSSDSAELDKPELAYITENSKFLKTLVIILTIPIYTECRSSKSSKTLFKIELPKSEYFKYIFDLNYKKFVFENPTSSPATEKPPIAISFVANRQLPGGMEAGFELIEVNIGSDGTQVITSLAKQAGVAYQIKAIAKNGLIVAAYDHRTKNSTSHTYLVSKTKWTLLSTKTIFVEPAVVSTDLKTLYGRRVKDAANSTVIFAQNLKTGSTPSYFDAAKHGGGFICGVVSDPTFKLGYFTHLTKKSTDIYQIDLSNGKMKKLGATTAGACIDATDANGNFIAKYINPTSLEMQKGDLILISKKNPKSYRHVEIKETFMHTGMHSLLPFGDYILGWNSTNNLHLVGLEKQEGFSFDYLDPETLAGPIPLHFLQYMCNLPLTWQSDPARPSASKAKF